MQLGLTSFEKMKHEVKISKDPAMNALVPKVGKRIATVAPMPNAQGEFVVFDSERAGDRSTDPRACQVRPLHSV
jgi:predicted Zn-dependent protease